MERSENGLSMEWKSRLRLTTRLLSANRAYDEITVQGVELAHDSSSASRADQPSSDGTAPCSPTPFLRLRFRGQSGLVFHLSKMLLE